MLKETKLLREYVSRIDEACGEGRDFVIVLKYAKREDAIKKILAKCEVGRSFKNVLTKAKYKDKEVSVFITGKLLLKGIKGRKSVEKILEELLA